MRRGERRTTPKNTVAEAFIANNVMQCDLYKL